MPGRSVLGLGHLLCGHWNHVRRAAQGRALRGCIRLYTVDGSPLSASEAGQFLVAASKSLGTSQWEWIASARILSRQRQSTVAVEQVLDGLLSSADQAMVNAFTGGFRGAQTQLAINKALPDPTAAAAALESAQV